MGEILQGTLEKRSESGSALACLRARELYAKARGQSHSGQQRRRKKETKEAEKREGEGEDEERKRDYSSLMAVVFSSGSRSS